MAVNPITPETQALLDAIVPGDGKTSSADTDALYAMTAQIDAALDACRARAQSINTLRRKADATEESPEVYAHFERIKQTADAMTRIAGELAHGFDQLKDTAFQSDQYAIDMKKSIDGRAERMGASVPG